MRAALCESTIIVRSVTMPLAFGIDQKQRQPVAFAGGAGGARGDDQEIGGVAVDHKGLVAVELESVAGTHRGMLVCSGRCFAPSSMASAASSEPSEIFGRYCDFCASLPPRDRAEAASTLVARNGDGIKVRPISSITTPASTAAEPAAAEFLRHQQAGKSHLGKGLPELARKSGCVLRIAQLTQMRHRRLVADKTARAVAQHGLFFGEDEGHGWVPV